MTVSVANPAENRMAQRFTTLRQVSDTLRTLDHSQIAGDLHSALSQRLAAPRYRMRLERRFLRRTDLLAHADALFDGAGAQLAALGEAGLRNIVIDSGIMCQYAALRRIVDQSVLSDLSAQIGMDVADHDARRATHGTAIDLARAIASPDPERETEALIHAILRDGLQCWTCWVHAQPAPLARFYDALMLGLPQSGTNIASPPCKPRDCRRRADLFDLRMTVTLADREDRTQGDA